jgi:hypothetical protein
LPTALNTSASSKMRGEFDAPTDARQFRMRISRNVSAVTAEPRKPE